MRDVEGAPTAMAGGGEAICRGGHKRCCRGLPLPGSCILLTPAVAIPAEKSPGEGVCVGGGEKDFADPTNP